MQPVPLAGARKSDRGPDGWLLFPTILGWTAVGWNNEGLAGVRMGYHSREALHEALGSPRDVTPPLWCQRLADRLQAYCSGGRDDFRDVPVAALWSTPFQQKVIAALRAVEYGDRTTYRDLAAIVGHAGAARAVGQVMATNPVPLVVPCHRVLASGGKLGGFSAPTGIALKQQLLELEAAGRADNVPAAAETR